MIFIKPSLSLDDQIQLLLQRNLSIIDTARAMRYLENIGYYRLSAYMIPFYENSNNHTFKQGTTFDDILNLYIFDRKLRLLILEAIERIEISFRSNFINTFAQQKGPHAYLEKKYYKEIQGYAWLLAKIDRDFKGSKEAFITHYKKKYSSPVLPPIWMSVHLLTFKELSIQYDNINNKDITKNIANFFNLEIPVMSSWMRSLSDLRNLCAHHSRVFNRTFGVKAVIPKTKPKKWLSQFPDLIDIGNNNKISPRNSLYFHIVVIWYFISQMNNDSSWLDRFVSLCKEHSIDMEYLGFAKNWKDDAYWGIK